MKRAPALAPSMLMHLENTVESVERAFGDIGKDEFVHRALRLSVPFLFAGVAAQSIISLWRMPYLLAGILLALAVVKHRFFPIRMEWAAFGAIAVMGAYAEAQIMLFGRTWAYADAQFAGIPVWLPVLWGLVGVTLITGYNALFEPFQAHSRDRR